MRDKIRKGRKWKEVKEIFSAHTFTNCSSPGGLIKPCKQKERGMRKSIGIDLPLRGRSQGDNSCREEMEGGKRGETFFSAHTFTNCRSPRGINSLASRSKGKIS